MTKRERERERYKLAFNELLWLHMTPHRAKALQALNYEVILKKDKKSKT